MQARRLYSVECFPRFWSQVVFERHGSLVRIQSPGGSGTAARVPPDRDSGVFSFWRARVPGAGEDKKPMLDESVVMDFFLRLSGTDEEKRLNFRYFLALILMRKKLLKFIDVRRRDDKEYLVLKRPREEQEHEVYNPQLDEEQLEQVREDLSQILEADV